jgi:hypothetical protein
MKSLSVLAALAALSFAAAAPAAPVVEVVFVNPDRYADASPGSFLVNERERDAMLELLRRHLQSLGAKHLAEGDRLRVEILDLDLAGEFESWRLRGHDVRILRDATPPRIHLRYTLARAGVESAGEERLAGLNYLRQASRCRSGGPLCHERLLLDWWFASRIVGEVAQQPR